MRRSAPLILLLLASACTVGPNYKEPTPDAPAAFAEPQPSDGDVDLARWWEAYDDPELTHLIEIGLQQAPDLQTAQSRVREARYEVIQARAQGLPSVNGTGNAEYIKLKQIGSKSDIDQLIQQIEPQPAERQRDGDRRRREQPTGIDPARFPHLLGRVRRELGARYLRRRAALGRGGARAGSGGRWNARDARVSLAAEIASDYLQMRGYQEQARIAAGEADRQARALSILKHTAQVGLVPQGNAIRQRTQLAQAQAQIAPLQAQAASQIHAIGVLIGERPRR